MCDPTNEVVKVWVCAAKEEKAMVLEAMWNSTGYVAHAREMHVFWVEVTATAEHDISWLRCNCGWGFRVGNEEQWDRATGTLERSAQKTIQNHSGEDKLVRNVSVCALDCACRWLSSLEGGVGVLKLATQNCTYVDRGWSFTSSVVLNNGMECKLQPSAVHLARGLQVAAGVNKCHMNASQPRHESRQCKLKPAALCCRCPN
jgi:hypothetical protein